MVGARLQPAVLCSHRDHPVLACKPSSAAGSLSAAGGEAGGRALVEEGRAQVPFQDTALGLTPVPTYRRPVHVYVCLSVHNLA